MPEYKVNKLTTEIETVIYDIEEAIIEVQYQAARMGISKFALRNQDGSSVVAPLLVAKAQALHALVILGQVEEPV